MDMDRNEGIGYEYNVPQQTSDGWETASLNSVGMNEDPLVEMMNILLNRDDVSFRLTIINILCHLREEGIL